MTALREHLAHWHANPRRRSLSYIYSRLRVILLGADQAARDRIQPLDPPIETGYIEILSDPAFQRSVSAVKERTYLDEARLANLWNMVRLVGPGTFLEVGSYLGGTAMHLCNAIDAFKPGAKFYCFDPFEHGGFEKMTDTDRAFKPTDFMDTSVAEVTKFLSSKPYATVVQGFFPAVAEGLNLSDIAFCHLDVDVHDATLRSLEYLAPRLAPSGLIVIDDFGHSETPGVEKATMEFLAAHPSFVVLPMFPCQALLMPNTFRNS
ncbi:MAG TPA: class I SAM-dependent methyltransferase [Terracidiphilus sp.]|jgi:O-methyltransferase|nr:class I SAM-dependent methyltransferase [Terracidiphilus sp.]